MSSPSRPQLGPVTYTKNEMYISSSSLSLNPYPLHVGLGGFAAAIAIARAGATVTVLEAAPALGEIGAGIQMTPNVARLLER
ncbi:hypothetical protein MMC30_005460 [Trapelia coarctata]|nr:hypothetical protein [Trapelia coarctata]